MDTSEQNPDPPQPRPEAATTDALSTFLKDGGAPCPRCRYDLRGVTAGACPECGLKLQLELRDPRRAWAGAGFLLLALLWLFTAATMNTARNARAIIQSLEYAERNPRAAAMAQFEAQIAAMESRLKGASEQVRASYLATLNSFRQSQQQMLSRYPEYDSWLDVVLGWPPASQAGAAWAAGLCLGSLAGLVWYFLLRARPATPAGVARLKVFALTLFGVYASWHLYLFWGEFGV